MKRALMYASVASMIQQFNMNNIKILQGLGYKVDVACNFEFGSTISNEKIDKLKLHLTEIGVDFYHIPVPRKISDIENLRKSYRQTKELINKNSYDLIHCHSPIGGIVCRLANKNSNHYENSRMIYTAHGFHFFKGNNPLKNFIFKNIEKYGARYTDTLITINKEDYEASKQFKLRKNGKIKYVPGVGIDVDKINSINGNREKLCKELNIPNDSILLLSVGELNDNKNHKVVIESLSSLPDNVHYLICGVGSLKEQHIQLAKERNVENRLHLLGYKNNIIEIMKSCDVFIFPSKREGLSVALMEAMACDMTCIASNIRGNIDLIKDKYNGFLFCSGENEAQQIYDIIMNIKENGVYFNSLDKYQILKKIDRKNVEKDMQKIYEAE